MDGLLSLDDFKNGFSSKLEKLILKIPLKIENLTIDEYIQSKLNIDLFWKLLQGEEFTESIMISKNRECFNNLPTKIVLTHKLILDPTQEESSDLIISNYNLEMCNLFESNIDIFPIWKGDEMVFYPLLSPLWLSDGNPELGYISLNSEWIQQYIIKITTLCNERNLYYQNHRYLNNINNTLYSNHIQPEPYILSLLFQKSKKDSEFNKLFIKYIKEQKQIVNNILSLKIVNQITFDNLITLLKQGKYNNKIIL